MKASERQKEQFKKRYEDNKEEIYNKIKQYRKDNPEKLSETRRRYYLKNREEEIRKSLKYIKENSLKKRLYIQKRRGYKSKTSDGSITEKSVLELFIKQKNKCVFCKKNFR